MHSIYYFIEGSGNIGGACCFAYSAECLACSDGIDVDEFCRRLPNKGVPGCQGKLLVRQLPNINKYI